jgi:hypothetical protein
VHHTGPDQRFHRTEPKEIHRRADRGKTDHQCRLLIGGSNSFEQSSANVTARNGMTAVHPPRPSRLALVNDRNGADSAVPISVAERQVSASKAVLCSMI